MQKKKLLGSALALAMVVPFSQANAELLKGLKWGGQLDLQGTAAHNVTDFATHPSAAGVANNDRIGDMQTRVMTWFGFDLLDDVHSMITLRKNDRTWGSVGAAGTANGSQSLQPAAAGTVMGNIFVDQAYVKIDKLANVDATLGRQFYGESGDLVIFYGPSDKAQYGMPVTALDAARFDWSNDTVGLTGIVAKQTSQAALGPQAAAATDIQGLTAMLKGHENMSAGAYVYRVVTHNIGGAGIPPSNAGAGGLNTFAWIAGLKGKANLGSAAWIAAEIAKNFGTTRQTGALGAVGSRNLTGMGVKVDAGAKAEVSGIGALMPWLTAAYGTGDSDTNRANNNGFQSIRGDFRPGAIYGRFGGPSGVAGSELAGTAAGANTLNGSGSIANRVILGAGVKVTPSAWQKLTAGVSVWNFHTQTSATPLGTNNVRPFQGNKNIGTEADLDLSWKHSDNVTVGVGLASFQPGGAIKEAIRANADATGSSPARLAYADVRIKWGGQ